MAHRTDSVARPSPGELNAIASALDDLRAGLTGVVDAQRDLRQVSERLRELAVGASSGAGAPAARAWLTQTLVEMAERNGASETQVNAINTQEERRPSL
jgi:hypothetical protein